MKTRTEQILAVLNVLSWIVFIGLLIKAGAFLTSYIVSIGNPEGAKNLYMGLNLYSIRQFDFWYYTGVASLMIALEIIKAYIAYLVTRVLAKIKLANPFTVEVSNLLERISYVILLTWVVAMLCNAHLKWLSKSLEGLQQYVSSGDFLLLAGVVFVFSQIFKKGVELQSENELTV
jgi:Ca2+/Na+ antiporter